MFTAVHRPKQCPSKTCFIWRKISGFIASSVTKRHTVSGCPTLDAYTLCFSCHILLSKLFLMCCYSCVEPTFANFVNVSSLRQMPTFQLSVPYNSAVLKFLIYFQFKSCSNGERWKKHKKLISPAFQLRMLKQKVPLFNDHALALIEDLKTQASEPSSNYLSTIKRHYFNALSGKTF